MKSKKSIGLRMADEMRRHYEENEKKLEKRYSKKECPKCKKILNSTKKSH